MRALFLAMAILASSPAAAQTILACHSDGTEKGQMREVAMPLPRGTKHFSATVTEPESGGPNQMQILLVGGAAGAEHYAGITTNLNVPPAPGPDGKYSTGPTHWRGFALNLINQVVGTTELPPAGGWFLGSHQFTMDVSLEQPGKLSVRLSWMNEGAREERAREIAIVRNDFKQLSVSCYFGDVTVSDIRFK